MSWLNDEILFYGGILLAVISCLSIIIYILTAKIKETKIKAQLVKEYGEPISLLREKK